MNRRQLLKLLSLATTSGFALSPAYARSQKSNRELTYGLFFGDEDLPRIRRNFTQLPEFAEFRNTLRAHNRQATYDFIANDLQYNDQLFDIVQLSRTAENQAFLYLMEGDPAAAQLAKDCIEEIMKFEFWDFFKDGPHPIGVQRASSSAIAVCLVSDFLGPALEPDTRRRWIETMGRRGCEPCFRSLYGIRYPQEVVGWLKDPESSYFEHRPNDQTDLNRRARITRNTNLRAVPASALVISTLTLQKELGASADTDRWLEMGVFSLEVFRDIFQPDGYYDEERGYAYYTAEHIQQAAVMLLRHADTDIMDIINWDGLVHFFLQFSMPTHNEPNGVVNFGDSGLPYDSGREFTRTALPFWVAAQHANGEAQWFGTTLGGAHTFWAPIWHDPGVASVEPAHEPSLWISDLDRVVARTGFRLDDMVVAMRSGPGANHEHADRNSIIVTAFGEVLVADPLRPPYQYSDPSWSLRLTEGHSAVLIDGQGHDHHNGADGTNSSQAFAWIPHKAVNRDFAQWTSNATQAYRLVNLEIKSVTRTTLVLFEERVVILVDRLSKWKNPSTLHCRFMGYNEDGRLKMEGREGIGFRFNRPYAYLTAQGYSRTGLNAYPGKMDIAPERAEAHPFYEIASAPATEVEIITVLGLSKTGETYTPATFQEMDGGVTIQVQGKRVEVAQNAVPVVT